MTIGRPLGAGAVVSEHVEGRSVSASTYTHYGCRCNGCRADKREKRQEREGRVPIVVPEPDPSPYVDPDWRELAACAGYDPAVFFRPKGGSAREAKQMCAKCPVLAQCRAEALSETSYELVGVWGGTTTMERRRMRRAMRAA